MRPRASAVVLIGFTLATLSAIGAEGRDAGEPEKDYSKLPLEQRPYYYDKVLDDKFFQNTSAAFMRLVRNTITRTRGGRSRTRPCATTSRRKSGIGPGPKDRPGSPLPTKRT